MQPKCLQSQSTPRIAFAAAMAGLLVGVGVPAAVAQPPPTESLIERACASSKSNVELRDCLGKFAEKADRDLNAVWKRVLASIDASELKPAQRLDWRKKLTAAQRHWVQFRQADCSAPVGYEWFGGTGMGGAVSTCIAKHTLDRIQHLEARYLDRK
jgi:uncharacterized protein YecT (DUF1311 family)